MVFISCTVSGFIKSYEYSNGEKELYSFISFIRYIKREVTLYLTRQQDIFAGFEDDFLEKTGFLPRLRNSCITDEKSPLYHVFCEFEEKFHIKSDGKRAIKEFAETFGRVSVKEQEEKCNLTVALLEEIYRREKEENSSRIKLCRYVGGMVGAGLVLLFI